MSEAWEKYEDKGFWNAMTVLLFLCVVLIAATAVLLWGKHLDDIRPCDAFENRNASTLPARCFAFYGIKEFPNEPTN